MDPNANLKEMLELANHILNGGDMTTSQWDIERDRLAELVIALDRWISKGGFLPDRWKR